MLELRVTKEETILFTNENKKNYFVKFSNYKLKIFDINPCMLIFVFNFVINLKFILIYN